MCVCVCVCVCVFVCVQFHIRHLLFIDEHKKDEMFTLEFPVHAFYNDIFPS